MLIRKVEQFLVIAVLIGQLCCQGWYFPGVSIFPAYLLCLAALGMLSVFVLLLQNGGMVSIKGSFVPLSLLLILNIVLVCLVNGKVDFGRIMLIICSFTFCLACTQAFRTKEEVERLLKWYIGIVLVSALVEIGQVFEIPFCTDLWSVLHADDKITAAIETERYLGLAGDSLAFCYHVSAALAVLLFIRFKKANGLIKAVLFGVFLYALFTNATRSGMMAFLAGFAIWVFTKKRSSGKVEKLWKALGTAAFVLTALLLIFDSSSLLSGTRFDSIGDSSAKSRIPMLLTAFNHALHYPFGMGVYSVQPDLIVNAGAVYSYVLKNTAHNLLGNCVASYGFIGLGLMLGLYGWAFNTYRKKKKLAEDPAIYMIAFCGLLGLAINAFFHNSYILNGEISSFLFFAILHTSCTKANTGMERECCDEISVRSTQISPKSVSNY